MKDESGSTTCQIEVEIIYDSFGYAIIFFYQFIFAKYRLYYVYNALHNLDNFLKIKCAS